MRLRKFALLLTPLAGLLLGSLLLAGAHPLWAQYVQGPKLTIINHSGYPDNQVYLVFWAIPYSETDLNNNFHRLDWGTSPRTFPLMDYTQDNKTTVKDANNNPYADYSITLDKLDQDSAGGRYFYLPKKVDATVPEDKSGFKVGRLWISFKTPVYTHVWLNTSVTPNHLDHTQPDYTNSTDANYNTVFDFFEPAIDPIDAPNNLHGATWGDTTQVDAVAIPLLYELKNGSQSLGKKGHNRPLRFMRNAFLSTDPTFAKLVTATNVLAPGHGIIANLFPNNYFANYINYCWGYWDGSTTAKTLTFYYDKNSDGSLIKWSGSVDSGTQKLKLTGTVNSASEDHFINKPSTSDVFLCNGAFDAGTPPSPEPVGWTGRDKDLKNQVSAAMNRTVFHLDPYPDGDHTSIKFPWQKYGPPYGYGGKQFYQKNGLTSDNFATNVYSKLDHQLSYDGCAYGFAYDDNGDSSSTISGQATDIILTIGNSTGLPLPCLDLLQD